RPVKARAGRARAIVPGYGKIEAETGIGQTRIGIEPVDIDHCGDEAPEVPVRPLAAEDREAADKASPALHQVHGSGNAQILGFEHRPYSRPLRRHLTVIEAYGG